MAVDDKQSHREKSRRYTQHTTREKIGRKGMEETNELRKRKHTPRGSQKKEKETQKLKEQGVFFYQQMVHELNIIVLHL